MSNSANWKDVFLELLLRQTTVSFREAIALKDKHAPDVLFKFFAPTDHAFKNLSDQTVFLASPAQFNDPYDSGLTMDALPSLRTFMGQHESPELDHLRKLGLSVGDLQDLLEGKMSTQARAIIASTETGMPPQEVDRFVELVPKIMQQVSQELLVDQRLQPFFQKGLKVTCFSERASSLLLWAHYAAEHKGFCVEYGYRDMPEDVPQRRLLFPVLYRQGRFDIGASMHEFMIGKKDFMPNHAIIAALHKAVDWAYESEWRIVNPDGREDGFTVPMRKPRAVHAGLRMSVNHRQQLESICTSLGVPLRTPKLSAAKYELVIEGHPSAEMIG